MPATLDSSDVLALSSRAHSMSCGAGELVPMGSGADVGGHLNSGLSGTVTRFQCTTTPNAGIYHVDAVVGDPVYVYFVIIDRPRAYVIAVNGTGAIAIDGPADRAITPAMVTNADPATWDAIRAIGPYGA